MKINNPILALAIPSVISNITVPLLSMVDMAIVGHMPDAGNIGGIYVGSTIFSMIYWIFGFLRMGTTGIVSQAYGARDNHKILYGLYRSLLLAGIISAVLLILQNPILWLALKFIESPGSNSITYATAYFHVCIWGAPAMMASYAISGWFIGMHDTKTPMVMAITQNVVNILMSLLFVYVFKAGISGVACGTVIGIYSGVLLGVYILCNRRYIKEDFKVNNLLISSELWRFVKVNRDIFLRTICMVVVTVSFTKFSTQLGDTILGANAIIMQFFILFSYFMDGLANSAEALSGETVGQNNLNSLVSLKSDLFKMGTIWAIAFTLIYLFFGRYIINILTNDEVIRATAYDIAICWSWLIPIASMAAFIWDGIFIGLTWSRGMLIATFSALVTFFLTYYIIPLGERNNSLWIAFLTYLATRGAVQWIIWKIKINQRTDLFNG